MVNKYFLYIRRSDIDSVDNNYQLLTQIESIKYHLKDYFKLNDNEIEDIPFYKDVKVEGVTSLGQREAFGKLMKDICEVRENDYNIPIYLIAYRQDRISRNQSVLCELKKFVSNKGIKLHYSDHRGEIKPEISTMINIVDTFERKNTISRINAFYKANKDNWGNPRVGFGWDFESPSNEYPRGRKVPNSKEYPILLEIKDMYENGEIITDIVKKLNEKYTEKEWDSTRIKFICEKNRFEWCKNINKDYFEDKLSNGLLLFKIKDFLRFLEDNNEIKTSSDFWGFFNKKSLIKPYYEGVKVNKATLKKYFEVDEKGNFENKIVDRIKFWLNEDENYSLYEIKTKLIEEFGDNERYGKKVKGWSRQSVQRRVYKARGE